MLQQEEISNLERLNIQKEREDNNLVTKFYKLIFIYFTWEIGFAHKKIKIKKQVKNLNYYSQGEMGFLGLKSCSCNNTLVIHIQNHNMGDPGIYKIHITQKLTVWRTEPSSQKAEGKSLLQNIQEKKTLKSS